MSVDLTIMLLSAVPVGELRASLPLALEVYELPVWRALLNVYVGNAVPAVLIVLLANPVIAWTTKNIPRLRPLLEKIFQHTENRWKEKHEVYGVLALFLFVAIPFPLTGVYSASLAAVLFQIRPKVALPAILGGMVTAGVIVLLVTKGIVTTAGLF